MEPLKIAGYDIVIGKNSYMETKLLDQPLFRGPVEEQLRMIIEHPDMPMFLQRSTTSSNLNFIRRARILDTYRLYVRTHPHKKIAVIAAFCGRAAIKRDEKSGALDFHFQDVLLKYKELGYMPVEILHVLERKTMQDESDKFVHYKSNKPHFVIQEGEAIDEERAMALLACDVKFKASSNPLISYVLYKIQNHWSGRIIADVISDGLATDVDDLKKKRGEIAAYLKKLDLPWRVLFDAVSGKLMIIPLEEIRFYASGIRGGHFMMKGR